MSPLIRRMVTARQNGREHTAPAEFYVPPSEVQPGDKVLEPTARQLADLQVLYPDEFDAEAQAAAARSAEEAEAPERAATEARRLAIDVAWSAAEREKAAREAQAIANGEESREQEGERPGSEEERRDSTGTEGGEQQFPAGLSPAEFAKLQWMAAVAAVKKTDDADLLRAWATAEFALERPRTGVVTAFAEKGITPPAPEA